MLVDEVYEDGHPIAVTCHHYNDDFANADSEARISDMGITLYPTLIPDGQPEPSYPYNYGQLVGVINDRMAIPAPCTINMTGTLIGNDLTVNVTVLRDAGVEISNPRVQVVITENDIYYDSPNYNYEMNHVNRDMVNDNSGNPITFDGDIAEVTVTATFNGAWNQDNITIVAFVENSATLEIYQAIRSDMDEFLFDPAAPGLPEDFAAIVDPTGALNCDLSWTNPSETYGGETLTELIEMRLYRDGELIYTDSSPEIGGAGSYYDEVDADGSYIYWLAAYNSASEGPLAIQEVWIGEDVPASVSELILTDQEGSAYLTWENPVTGLHGGAFNNPIEGYHIERSDGTTFELTGIFTEYIDATVPAADYYSYSVVPYNTIGDGGTAESNTEWIGSAFSGIIILDFDLTPAGDILQAAIENSYDGTVVVTSDVNAYPLTSGVDAVFILLGIYPNNYALTEVEAGLLTNYLDDGGNVYIEGGDTWYFDTATSVHPYFNITGTADGAYNGDLLIVTGFDFLSGMSWDYTGENSYIDNLEAIAPAVPIFSNDYVGYDCGIAYDEGTYRTIGTSFEITGLGGANTLDEAIYEILDFFDVLGTGSDDSIIPLYTELHNNYPNPFNPVTNIKYSLKKDSKVSLEVYNIKGQLVRTLIKDELKAGNYEVIWEGLDDNRNRVSSGVYFYKLNAGDYSSTKKMILLK
ncbi:Omp28-related outer membrane protein [Candidatus Cloacimonadota bacterium]